MGDLFKLATDSAVLLTAALIIGKLISGNLRADLTQLHQDFANLRHDFDTHRDEDERNQHQLLTEIAFLRGQLSGLTSQIRSAIANGENSRL